MFKSRKWNPQYMNSSRIPGLTLDYTCFKNMKTEQRGITPLINFIFSDEHNKTHENNISTAVQKLVRQVGQICDTKKGLMSQSTFNIFAGGSNDYLHDFNKLISGWPN